MSQPSGVSTSTRQRPSREKLLRSLRQRLRRQFPDGGGMDRLLSDPFTSILLGLDVAGDCGLIDVGTRRHVAAAITELVKNYPAAVEEIHFVCRRAMNLRKTGELKGARAK